MFYRLAGDAKIGYDLGVGTGTYGGYVQWVRTLVWVWYGGMVRGYGAGMVRGYGRGAGTGVRCGGTVYWYSTCVPYRTKRF